MTSIFFPPEIKGEMSCCDKDAGDSETKKEEKKKKDKVILASAIGVQ